MCQSYVIDFSLNYFSLIQSFFIKLNNCVAEVLCCTGIYSMHGGSHNYNNVINILCILHIMFYGSKENTGFRADIAIDNINIKPGHCWTEVTGQCIVGQTSMLWHLVNVFYDNLLYYEILTMNWMTSLYIMTSVNELNDNPLYYDILSINCMITLYIMIFFHCIVLQSSIF